MKSMIKFGRIILDRKSHNQVDRQQHEPEHWLPRGRIGTDKIYLEISVFWQEELPWQAWNASLNVQREY
jgi:hypothetical protein